MHSGAGSRKAGTTTGRPGPRSSGERTAEELSNGSSSTLSGRTRSPDRAEESSSKSHAEDAWWELWQGPEVPEEAQARFSDGAAGLVPMQDVWALTGKRLWAVARAQTPNAPGPDGWTAVQWKRWPLAVWDHLAELLAVVESTARWPTTMYGAHVLMLPKGGPPDGLAARPINLMPGVYRLWAKARLWHWKWWFRTNGLRPLLAGP